MGKAIAGLFGGGNKPTTAAPPAQPAGAVTGSGGVTKGTIAGNQDPNSVGQARLGGGIEKRASKVPGLSL